MKKAVTIVLTLAIFTIKCFANVTLPKIFGDNMVLQRNKAITIWGHATAGEKITVGFNGQNKNTKTDKQGNWQVILDQQSAGGPFNLLVKGNNTLTVKNILIGEVWICSGQSNMEMPIEGWGKINNYQQEINGANFPLIRHFKVPDVVSTTLKDDLGSGDWKVCSPATVGGFSATAYFFARELYNELKVPIGLINTSWGGTQSEAWTSAQAFETSPELQYIAAAMKTTNLETTMKERSEKVMKKIMALQGSFENNANTDEWKNNDFDDSKWPLMQIPGLWETQNLQDLDGFVWFRKIITVTDADAAKEAILQLGMIDDNDDTYVNGIKIGSTTGYNIPRKYTIAPGVLKPGKNVIAVKVTDTKGGGGIYGNANDVTLTIAGNEQKLSGNWAYRVAQVTITPMSLGPNDYPSLLYNSMINPLLRCSIAGAIWYQGEANAERAFQYRSAFPLMITDWRQHFKQGDFPFIFVQLSTFGSAKGNSNNGSDWAELREAQFMALRLPFTGMAVTTDIGNPADIHPKNKQDVGKRLASIALHDVYAKAGEFTGPLYQAAKADGNKMIISFTHTGSGLLAKDKYGYVKGFEIAGADKHFYYAKAMIEGDKIIVMADEVAQPLSVRYNWANDASDGNLYNKELFPAAPFRTDDWPGITDKNKFALRF